jgi:phosphatidylethanolamine-binding protein (PEBP) family uncharacterized protein
MNVQYQAKKINNTFLSRNNTLSSPTIQIKPESNKLFTLLMSDPDAPTDIPGTSWLHWLIVNIPGDIPVIENGDEIMHYSPPTPPSGTHRYIFTLYEQPNSILYSAPSVRTSFNTKGFERQFLLKKITSKQIRVSA